MKNITVIIFETHMRKNVENFEVLFLFYVMRKSLFWNTILRYEDENFKNTVLGEMCSRFQVLINETMEFQIIFNQ